MLVSIGALDLTDIWKIGSEITVDKKAPTVRYNKFAEEYRIVYRLNLTEEEEAEIMGLNEETVPEGSESSSAEDPSAASSEPPSGEQTGDAETTVPSSQKETTESTALSTDPAETETVLPPTQTDESYSNGSKRVTLILGLVIGIAVIYLIVITIGTNSRGKNRKKKNRL